MNKSQQKRFDSLYQQHLKALKRQGKAEATIDATYPYLLGVLTFNCFLKTCDVTDGIYPVMFTFTKNII